MSRWSGSKPTGTCCSRSKLRSEQAGAHQQHDAERELHRDEELAHPVAAAPGRRRRPWSASASSPRVAVSRRHRAEHEPGPDRDREREEQHRPVEPDVPERGQAAGHGRHQRRDPPAGERARRSVPPISASTTLSVRSWRTSRARPAPSAARSDISRRRAVARASWRLAMLAQAMSRISATKPEQDQQRRADVAHEEIAQRCCSDARAPALVSGILGGERPGDAAPGRPRPRAAVTPARVRPTPQNAGFCRVTQSGSGADVTGSQISVGPNGSWKSAAVTPITDVRQPVEHQRAAEHAGVGRRSARSRPHGRARRPAPRCRPRSPRR